MPPTNATSPSTITSFSWWQCIGRSWESSAHCTRVPRDELLAHARARPRESGVKTRQRRARPQQHPHVDPLGQLAEQVAQPRRSLVARQPEVGRDVPAGDVDVRARSVERLGDRRQGLLAVDQDLERAAGARRRIARAHSQPSSGGSSCARRPTRRSAPVMVAADPLLHALAGPSVDAPDRTLEHAPISTS